MAKKSVKCVMVGDGAVGKMCMATTYVTGNFPNEYVPVVFENMEKEVSLVNEGQITLHLWITAGQEDYDRLRPLSYPETDIVMLCFCPNDRYTMENIKQKWLPEIKHFCPKVPYMIVATKTDLRTDEEELQRMWVRYKEKPISTEEGRNFASKMGADCYMECSAKTRDNLNQTMEEAARIALNHRPRQKRKSQEKCTIA